ncbi:PREDICTED: protein ULTRAPETALA 1 [Ipomoea nil]|uniref:protein ULTRAPETALA 1 n=1 Tax=Ipomoea nil TaxID=35883 RepID=UPI000901B1BF|nr:PREDICTED: protein ULTRAPETALA 1 [Ipomoea nil]XP_019159152.1 PREDICTED: protein ULTRAPETALA 1 [Ipomoea nil]XP_019159153.1 PREDICTED: protein ULTRAPETALA 1 [Ipomoea nil]
MENGVEKRQRVERAAVMAASMFSDEEVGAISGVKIEDDYVEVTCGCTSHRYGDAVGRLRVFSSGDLEITCECTPGCQEDKMTPAAFEKHSGRETARKWKNNIWVIANGEKVPVVKTALLKYYIQSSKHANGSNRSSNGKACHRDEFIRCTVCNKERRFRLRTREECRSLHDALANANWKCSDMARDKVTCDDDEERASRRVYRGCSRSPTCRGCTTCVCFGCEVCRFPDCSCQTCIDFTRNVKA